MRRSNVSLSALLGCGAFALSMVIGHSVAAASPASLVYSAPEICPKAAAVQQRIVCDGLPPGITAAALKIEALDSGFDAQLTMAQGSLILADTMHTETCAGAVAWAVFVFNAAVPPGCTLERPAPEPALAITVAAGGTVNILQSFLPGAQLALEAEKWGVRAGVSGTYYQTTDLRTATGERLRFSQQLLTARVCGLTNPLFLGTRVGVCGVVDFAFLQRRADALSEKADNTEYWQDFGLAVILNRSLWAGLHVELGVGAAYAPIPGRDTAPASGADQHPRNDFRAELGLRVGYELLGGFRAAAAGFDGSRPAAAATLQPSQVFF